MDLEDLAPEPIEVNGLKGLRVSEIAAGPHGPEHTLAVVLTADQRRYWMLILRGAGGEDDQAVVADQRLLDAILEDVRAASGPAVGTRPGE